MELKNFYTVDEMEAEYAKLREKAVAANIDTWEDRAKAQTPHCKFGEEGVCCKNCSMGPCRITPKSPKGICGATADTIAARNYLRSAAAGSATHSDHGREVCHVLLNTKKDGPYKVTDEKKLLSIAKEWGIETENKDIYDVAHEVAMTALNEYGKPFGYLRYIERAIPERQQIWEKLGITPNAVDREISRSLHMTHVGCSADPEPLVKQAMRVGLADGWGGSMMGTDFSDVLFGTPTPRDTEANLGCIEEDQVNIVVHGHDPAMSEMICTVIEMPEYIAKAKAVGAKGINVVGLCCTANEVAMRHGIRMAGNFLQQENALLTGAIEMMVVDVQCIFPAIGPLSECFHTKFVTTSPIARIPHSIYKEFKTETALETAKELIDMAIDNFKNRDKSKVYIPQMKSEARIGYSCEAIIKQLDTVTNSFVDEVGSYRPLIECVKSGVLRGAVAIVGCNNPKVRADYSHIEIIKELIANDIIVVSTGCSSQAAAKAGLMSMEAVDTMCGEGLRRVCKLANIPPVLHMGSCVDISRMMLLANGIAKDWGITIPEVPVVGCAPEWMSEKAVSIANYVVSTGIDTYLGIEPQVKGSAEVQRLITEGTREWAGGGYYITTDPKELVKMMIEGIEKKREHLNI